MSIRNTGRKIYQILEQFSVLTGLSTGNTKPNLPSDPDYIAPIIDLTACPVPDSDIENITQIRARIINSTSQFINCANINISLQNNPIPVFTQSFVKGPGQFVVSNYQIQTGSNASITIMLTASSLNLPCKFRVIWKRNNTAYLIHESDTFTFDGSVQSIPSIQLPFNVLNEDNEVQIEFQDDNTTTTTTIEETTTTSSSTTTTTTEDPDSNILVFIDPQVDNTTKITNIDFTDIFGNVVSSITDNIDDTMGVQSYSVLNGVYKIQVTAEGVGGQSVVIQRDIAISQKYIGPGVYCFENIDITGGLSIIINDTISAISTVFARIEQGSTTTESTPYLPFGLIEREKADTKVVFYEDQACTTPATFSNAKVNFSIKLTNNLNSSEITNANYENCDLGVNEVFIADLKREKQWDYTLNDPEQAEDPDDLIADTSYDYDLLPTFGFIKV